MERKNLIISVLAIVIIALLAMYIYNNFTPSTQASKPSSETIYIYVIPDWGGPGYDAFVLGSEIGTSHPMGVTNGTPPPANNTIVVPVNTPIKFVIINLDNMSFSNYTGKPTKATIPFTIYNDTEDNGQVAMQFNVGDDISNIPAGHTFTIFSLGINIPIPAYSIVVFTYTFTHTGTYLYQCLTPCGPGMDYLGYMQGHIIVE